MIKLRAVEGASGELLATLLEERRILGGPGDRVAGVVSYGVKEQYLETDPNLPTLNRNAGKYNKFDAFGRMAALGVPIPKYSTNPDELTLPILARKNKHIEGKDIIPLLARDQTYNFIKASGLRDFYTQFIPTATEYRVWIYRRQHLATYRKVFANNPDRPIRGMSFDWAFEYMDIPPVELQEPAAKAVHALELDFGAVDVIKGLDGNSYVLEVNTAPWAHTRLRGLVRLVDKIVRWEQLGFPRRQETL